MENLAFNKEHYDQKYSKLDIDMMINKVHNYEQFLQDALVTDTSWHGLYYGGFERYIKGKRILELGCGDGLNSLIMAALGGLVTAIDISEASIQFLSKCNESLGLSVVPIVGDFPTLRIPENYFDIVVGKAFLHHLTHEQEILYIQKIVRVLKCDGLARFFEPAMNNRTIDWIRWIIPVRGRPSRLSRKAFQEWKENDPHPDRDNSSRHFREVGNEYFKNVKIVHIGSLERLHRLMPGGRFNRNFRRWAHKTEERLPGWFRDAAARSQMIQYSHPR